MNGDLLADLGAGPLGAGEYGMYIANYDFQQTASIATYSLDFVAQDAPEPSAGALVLLGVGLCVVCNRRLLAKSK